MIFNDHSKLIGQHAFLGASKYHWLNYNDEKLANSFFNYRASEEGTKLHEFAALCIRLNQKLARSKKTLNLYVNDAIGFRMSPEQVLYYSDYCFGTADAISFRDDFLRIHDLKTGVTPTHMEQLMIYAALFCLEYDVSPFDIGIELRIYQNDDCRICNPDPNDLREIMNLIVRFDKQLRKLDKQGG